MEREGARPSRIRAHAWRTSDVFMVSRFEQVRFSVNINEPFAEGHPG
jgi:hypothetical protein